ncbi:MAG: hypothetical protein GY784_00075 [Gammaproteobacteria bacterium]|nr:hypothetical protein [Gammaproteobacteria bacterium]
MSNSDAIHLSYQTGRKFTALVLGRAGLDLYPQPNGCKIKDALSFSSDLGGSAGNIAVAIARAGASAGLISALSNDAVGDFVRQRLVEAGVDIALITSTISNERTSLAIAEVIPADCEVVIYRNDPADLKIKSSQLVSDALKQANNLIVTGTSLIDIESRAETLAIMRQASNAGCQVWLDLDYRAWNWPDLETTRTAYREAVTLSRVIVGNEDEFSVLTDDFATQTGLSRERGQVVVLKRGSAGASLYAGKTRLDSGIYRLEAVKPYGAGDAFLGNLLVHYMHSGDWLKALDAGSAAAALVVSQRGCASAMPDPDELKNLQQTSSMTPAATWS